MSHSSKTEITQAEINDLFRDLGSSMTQEELRKRLDGADEHVQFTTRKFIIDKGLTNRLFDAEWITEDQKTDIDNLGKTLKSAGKRRYSTHSKKYKKNNKRSKRTRTLRSKRYSRKS